MSPPSLFFFLQMQGRGATHGDVNWYAFVTFLVVYYFKCSVEKNKAYSCPSVAWILLSLNVEITEKELSVITVNTCKMLLGVHVDVIFPLTHLKWSFWYSAVLDNYGCCRRSFLLLVDKEEHLCVLGLLCARRIGDKDQARPPNVDCVHTMPLKCRTAILYGELRIAKPIRPDVDTLI